MQEKKLPGPPKKNLDEKMVNRSVETTRFAAFSDLCEEAHWKSEDVPGYSQFAEVDPIIERHFLAVSWIPVVVLALTLVWNQEFWKRLENVCQTHPSYKN